MDDKTQCCDCQYRTDDGKCDLYNISAPLTGECYNW